MTRLEFLQDLIDFYSADTSRRSLGKHAGNCQYRYNGKACAIGRHLLFYDYAMEGMRVHQLVQTFDCLSPEILNLGVDFLDEMQFLHDSDNYWCDSGLSELGEKHVQELKEKWLCAI